MSSLSSYTTNNMPIKQTNMSSDNTPIKNNLNTKIDKSKVKENKIKK